ncbi:ATP-binding protein [Sphingomonas sp. Leaf198]|uniref:ATP-binding protein n=1 Tax=Sphingomonas sp. Leaf198 TaxID=1736299 RepID=UPI000A89A822|nr:ATP-binding protein [Sphingomonas sp. Leaf198]
MSSVVEIVPSNPNGGAEPQPSDRFSRVGMVVQSEGGPSFQKLAILLEPGRDVRPGEFLAVWHGRRGKGDVLTVIQVDDCKEHNPNETPELAHTRRALELGPVASNEESSTRIFRVATCKTIEDLDTSPGVPAGAGASAPEMLCRAGDVAVRLPDDLVTAALGGLDHPSKGLNLGTLLGTTSPMTLSPEILQLHIGVFGNPGKGKSYASGTIIEEMSDWDVPGIILDVNGEMVDAVEALGGKVISLPDKNSFGLALNRITGQELASITPQVDLGRQYAELIESAHDALRTQRIQEELTTGKADDITIEDIVAKVTLFGQSSRSTKATSEIAIARVKRLGESRLIGPNFAFIEQLKKHRLICLDCRRLQLSETRLVAAAAARELQNYGRTCARRVEQGTPEEGDAEWLAVLFIDEAHNVVPEGQTTVTSNVLRELARMGRHSRTGLILASQSPVDLDASILKRMQTRMIFALERDQLKAIGGVRSDLGDELVDALPKLSRGICAVSGNGDQIRHGFMMKVRERRTPVGGGTPPVFATRVKRDRGVGK